MNAGSDEVSTFRVRPHGLTLLDVVDSGGDFPVSGSMSSTWVATATSPASRWTRAASLCQRATSWIAGAPGSRNVFTANTGSDAVSELQVDARGALTLLDGGVSASFPAGTAPIDLTMTRDGRFLYTLHAGAGTIAAFQVSRDGSLLPRGEAGGLAPGGGTQGIAVRRGGLPE
ncbi:beta-propeller fold lactonase family protein [Sorangium sp. So ce385]|uniref:beta-propeller fold lactonase family protein n=1 Tax=Sorangium sp. So ce385 TaxID=3133308 RepID=UPI003F5C057A